MPTAQKYGSFCVIIENKYPDIIIFSKKQIILFSIGNDVLIYAQKLVFQNFTKS